MKKLIVFATLLALILTAFAGCSDSKSKGGSSSNSSPEAAVENYVMILYGQDEPSKSELKALYPAAMWEARGGFDYEDLMEDRIETVESLKNEYGDDYKVSCEILGKEKMDKDMLEEGREAFDEQGMNGKKLTDAYTVEYEITFKGSESENSWVASATAFKYEGKWYVGG